MILTPTRRRMEQSAPVVESSLSMLQLYPPPFVDLRVLASGILCWLCTSFTGMAIVAASQLNAS